MLSSLASQRLARIQTAKIVEAPRVSLVDFVHQVTPSLAAPTWLEPYAKALEDSIGSDLRIVFAAPPQHGKSELTIRAFLWWDRYFPGRRHVYVTFNATRADEVSKLFRKIAEEGGFEPRGTLDQIVLRGGSSIKFTGIKGTLTGAAIDGVCVIDDPFKDARDAASPTTRRDAVDFWKSVARTRRHPGTSYVVMATRWHVEDLSGHLIKNDGFRYINLKAIAEAGSPEDLDDQGRVISDPLHRCPGESLWDRKPPSFFEEDRRDMHWWSSMYQGEPRPRGANVFGEVGGVDENGFPRGAQWYSELPTSNYRGAFGLDLAYTAKTSADWSICIEGIAHNGNLYVTDVQRKQVDAPSFALTLKSKSSQRPGWPMRWYCAGTEKAAADFIRRAGVPIKAMAATGDKFMRATAVAALWNSGKVLLPDPQFIDAGWLPAFLEVVHGFTGQGDLHDDDVDALAALHDQLMKQNRMYAAVTGAQG